MAYRAAERHARTVRVNHAACPTVSFKAIIAGCASNVKRTFLIQVRSAELERTSGVVNADYPCFFRFLLSGR